MKKRASIIITALMIWVFIQPENVDGTPSMTDVMHVENASEVNTCYSTSGINEVKPFGQKETEYSDLTISIEYHNSESQTYGNCEITLNGTIKTDIGTVTFEDMKIIVSLEGEQDCKDFAIDILKSFRDDNNEEKEES